MNVDEKINFEKDYLVIHRNKQGQFSNYYWYSADKATLEELTEKIIKWNKDQENKDDGRPAELINDPLIREICAYKVRVAPYNSVIEEAKDVQGKIDQAIDCLESALSDLNRMKGLE